MFSGTLDTAPVTALLGLLSRRARSGSLHLFGPATGVVQVLDGDVAFASARTGDDLGSELVRAGFLTTDDWQAAVASNDPARQVAGSLRRSGIDPERLHAHVRRQTEEAIWEVDRWQGDFVFEAEVTDPLAGAFRHPIPSLLLAVRRRDAAWAELATVVPSVDLLVAPAPARAGDDDDLTLSRAHYRLLGSVDGARSVRTLAGELALGLFRTTELVAGLLSAGLVTLVDRPVAAPVHEPTRAERLLVAVGASGMNGGGFDGDHDFDRTPAWPPAVDLVEPTAAMSGAPAPPPASPLAPSGVEFVSHREAPARDLILRLLSAVKDEL